MLSVESAQILEGSLEMIVSSVSRACLRFCKTKGVGLGFSISGVPRPTTVLAAGSK